MTRGFTLVEVVISMLVLSGLLVAVMSAVGGIGASRVQVVERAGARGLADDLLAEIVLKPYADPEAGLTPIGREAGEPATRASMDDVDDYHGLKESPPVEADGGEIAWAAKLDRTVTVVWATPASLSGTSGSGTGLKRIEVVVSRAGRVLAKATAIRSNAWDGAQRNLDEVLLEENLP